MASGVNAVAKIASYVGVRERERLLPEERDDEPAPERLDRPRVHDGDQQRQDDVVAGFIAWSLR